jgi:hypothetical protein
MRRRGASGAGRMAGRRRRRRRRRRLVLAGGAVMWAGHKMSQKDSQKIEEHTGKPPDELSDEEVEAAMGELGIEEQELTEGDKAAIEAAEDED